MSGGAIADGRNKSFSEWDVRELERKSAAGLSPIAQGLRRNDFSGHSQGALMREDRADSRNTDPGVTSEKNPGVTSVCSRNTDPGVISEKNPGVTSVGT